jgi:histidinol-phosphate aminotransferase
MKSCLKPRDAVAALAPYSSGRDAKAVRRDTGFQGEIIKLASNEGAAGPLPVALQAIEASYGAMHRYPEAHSTTLCAAIAELNGVAADRIIVTGGGCGLIAHLSSAYLNEGDEVVFGDPTFHLYRLEALRMGAKPVPIPLMPDGRYDLKAMLAAIGPRTRMVYVCTPNNPTGGLIARQELDSFLAELPEHVLPIIDEAYFEYVKHPDYPDPVRILPRDERPAIIMRTFSKIYGLAGLRVGYALAPAEAVATLRRIQNPYEVTRVAQAAALASLSDLQAIAERREYNIGAREKLIAELKELGLNPLPSHGNFVCVKVGAAKSFAKALEARGIIVRPLDAMGDPTSIRITLGAVEENAQALEQIRSVVKS